MKNLLSLFLMTLTLMFTSVGVSQTYDYNIADYGETPDVPFTPDWDFDTYGSITGTGLSGYVASSPKEYAHHFNALTFGSYSIVGILSLPSMGSYTDVQFVIDFSDLGMGDSIVVSTSNSISGPYTTLGSWSDTDGGNFVETLEFTNSGDTYIKLELSGDKVNDANGHYFWDNFQVNIDTTSSTSTPTADFTVSATTISTGSSVDFTNTSTTTGTVNYEWTFTGADTPMSTDENPTGIVYSTPGTYTVELTVTDDDGSDTETKVDYITVVDGLSVDEDASNFNVYSYNSNVVVKTTDISNYTMTIYNLNGQVVYNELTSGDNEFTLDVQSGIYIVNLTSEDGLVTTEKLSIQ